MPEFDLIELIRARAAGRPDVVLGIGDDAALLSVPPGHWLAVTQDTLNAGIHFPDDTAPADIGWKALAVNLSDLAAMGAAPAWCTLSLSLPEASSDWVGGFCGGFLDLAGTAGIALVGGDTTRGPLSISVTAHGLVPEGRALRRDGARVGDEVWVAGALGEAAAALALWREGRSEPALRAALDRPVPRVDAGIALRDLASACIDVSDGLLADLGHVLAASGVGAELRIADLPTSPALAAAFAGEARWALQLAGGDDYALCFTAPAERHAAVRAALAKAATPAACIGRVLPVADGLRILAPDGSHWAPPERGYQHFSGAP